MSIRPSARFAWAVAAVLAVVAALVALFSIVRGDFSETDGRIIATLALVLFTGGASFAGLTVVERGQRVGWALVAGATLGFLLVLPAIWGTFEESGDSDWELAWAALATLLAGLLWATAWLMARGAAGERLALAAGVLSALAALLTDVAVWTDDRYDGWGKALAAVWILAVLAYVLTPLVSRLTSSSHTTDRVLATLDDVELVVTTDGGLEPNLAPGERLLLRRRG